MSECVIRARWSGEPSGAPPWRNRLPAATLVLCTYLPAYSLANEPLYRALCVWPRRLELLKDPGCLLKPMPTITTVLITPVVAFRFGSSRRIESKYLRARLSQGTPSRLRWVGGWAEARLAIRLALHTRGRSYTARRHCLREWRVRVRVRSVTDGAWDRVGRILEEKGGRVERENEPQNPRP